MARKRRGFSRDGWLLLTIISALLVVGMQRGFNWIIGVLIVLFAAGFVIEIRSKQNDEE